MDYTKVPNWALLQPWDAVAGTNKWVRYDMDGNTAVSVETGSRRMTLYMTDGTTESYGVVTSSKDSLMAKTAGADELLTEYTRDYLGGRDHCVPLTQSQYGEYIVQRAIATPTQPGAPTMSTPEMPNNLGITNNTDTTRSALGEALKLGAKLTAANAANKAVVEIAKKKMAGGQIGAVLDDPMGEAAAKLLLPLIVMHMATAYPDQVPQSAMVKEGAQLAIAAAMNDSLVPLMDLALPIALEYAALGQATLIGTAPSAPPVKERETVHARAN